MLQHLCIVLPLSDDPLGPDQEQRLRNLQEVLTEVIETGVGSERRISYNLTLMLARGQIMKC